MKTDPIRILCIPTQNTIVDTLKDPFLPTNLLLSPLNQEFILPKMNPCNYISIKLREDDPFKIISIQLVCVKRRPSVAGSNANTIVESFKDPFLPLNLLLSSQ